MPEIHFKNSILNLKMCVKTLCSSDRQDPGSDSRPERSDGRVLWSGAGDAASRSTAEVGSDGEVGSALTQQKRCSCSCAPNLQE